MIKDTQKAMQKFLRSIERRLNMPRVVKDRVMNDLISSIQSRRELGKTDEEIFRELGPAKKAAAELNEQMKEYTYMKSPWRWACLVLVILCSASLLLGGMVGILMYFSNAALSGSIGIIGGADGPTAIFVTTSPDYYISQIVITVLLLVIAILGFYRLSHCPRKC